MSHLQPLSGVTIPTVNYSNSISEEFPNSNRMYKVESGIVNRYFRDNLPINANLTNGTVADNYIEFVLNSTSQEFYDLNSFALELKIKILNENGGALTPESKLSLIDGAGHRILSRCSLFLNGTACQSSAYFGLYNTIKSYLNMGKDDLESIGRNMYYKSLSTKIFDKIEATSFENLNSDETLIQSECKDVIHMTVPLCLDLSSADFYLLNGVDVRLRFDLSSPNLIINSNDGRDYKYSIQMVKLWTQKIVPNPDALYSLNKSLVSSNGTVEYIFERPVIKNFVFPSGHTILSLDNIFNGIIPHKIYMFFIRQSAVNGSYKDNAAFLTHCNISSLQLQVNGNIIASLNATFPKEVASVFHHTLLNMKNDKNLMNLKNFKEGRTIFTWDLKNSDSDDVLALQKSGNVRINLQSSIANTENIIAYVVGLSTGLLEIDANKRVRCSYTM